jgi:hypothetical protein
MIRRNRFILDLCQSPLVVEGASLPASAAPPHKLKYLPAAMSSDNYNSDIMASRHLKLVTEAMKPTP